MKIRLSGLLSHMGDWETGRIILVLKISRRELEWNVLGHTASTRCEDSLTFQGLSPSLVSGCCWWLGRTKTKRQLSVLFVPSHQHHPENGDGVSSWNFGEPSHFVVAVCPRTFHWGVMFIKFWGENLKYICIEIKITLSIYLADLYMCIYFFFFDICRAFSNIINASIRNGCFFSFGHSIWSLRSCVSANQKNCQNKFYQIWIWDEPLPLKPNHFVRICYNARHPCPKIKLHF